MSNHDAVKKTLLLVMLLFFVCTLWSQDQKDQPPAKAPAEVVLPRFAEAGP